LEIRVGEGEGWNVVTRAQHASPPVCLDKALGIALDRG